MTFCFKRFFLLIFLGVLLSGLYSCSRSPTGIVPERPDTALKLFVENATLTETNTCLYTPHGTLHGKKVSADGGVLPSFSWVDPPKDTTASVGQYVIIVDSNEVHQAIRDKKKGCAPTSPKFRCTHLLIFNISKNTRTTKGLSIQRDPPIGGGARPSFGITYSRYDSDQAATDPRIRLNNAYDGPCPKGYTYENPGTFDHSANASGKFLTYTAEIFAIRASNLDFGAPPVGGAITRASFREGYGPIIVESASVQLYYKVP